MNLNRKTALIVEDNNQNRLLCHDLLESKGYEVFEASTGMEGWKLAFKHHPDVILMDIQLPDVSGTEVTNWLKKEETLKDIPVIAVTIFSSPSDRKKILSEGCDGHIPKPISVRNFVQTVEFFSAQSAEGQRNA